MYVYISMRLPSCEMQASRSGVSVSSGLRAFARLITNGYKALPKCFVDCTTNINDNFTLDVIGTSRNVTLAHPLWLWFGLRPTFNHNYYLLHGHIRCSCSWKIHWPHLSFLLLMLYVKRRQTIYNFYWKVCPREIASYKFSPIIWPWSSLPMPHSNLKRIGTIEKQTTTIATTFTERHLVL